MSKAAHQLPKAVTLALQGLPWLILACGLIASYASFQRIHDRYRLEADGVAASGAVVWAATIGTGTSNQSFRIKVVYRDTAAQEWTRYFTVFSSQYRAGQLVDVVYLPAHPETAMLGKKEAGETHDQDILAAGAGILTVLVGGVMVWLRREQLRLKQSGRGH